MEKFICNKYDSHNDGCKICEHNIPHDPIYIEGIQCTNDGPCFPNKDDVTPTRVKCVKIKDN